MNLMLLDFSDWQKVFSQYSIMSDIARSIGWGVVKLLGLLCDAFETLLNSIYGLLDFTNYGNAQTFFGSDGFKIFITALFVCGLLYLGYTYITNSESRPKAVQNIALFVLVVTGLPMLFTTMNTLVVNFKDAIQISSSGTTADALIADNVDDLLYMDAQGFNTYTVDGSAVSGNSKNGFGANNAAATLINVNDVVTDETSVNTPDFFYKQYVVDSAGAQQLTDIAKTKFFSLDYSPWYYRYHIDFLTTIVYLLANILALFFVAFKVGKLIFELAFNQLFATAFSAVDIVSGKSIRAILKNIMSIYAVIATTSVLLKLYYLGQGYISDRVGGLTKAFMLIIFAAAVIDGPNIVERILGIDAGISSGFRTFASMFTAARTAAAVAGGVKRTAAAAVGSVAKAGGFGVGAANAAANRKSALSFQNESNVAGGNNNSTLHNENAENKSATNNGGATINGNASQPKSATNNVSSGGNNINNSDKNENIMSDNANANNSHILNNTETANLSGDNNGNTGIETKNTEQNGLNNTSDSGNNIKDSSSKFGTNDGNNPLKSELNSSYGVGLGNEKQHELNQEGFENLSSQTDKKAEPSESRINSPKKSSDSNSKFDKNNLSASNVINPNSTPTVQTNGHGITGKAKMGYNAGVNSVNKLGSLVDKKKAKKGGLKK